MGMAEGQGYSSMVIGALLECVTHNGAHANRGSSSTSVSVNIFLSKHSS